MRSNFQIHLAQNQSNKQLKSMQGLSPLEIHVRNNHPNNNNSIHPWLIMFNNLQQLTAWHFDFFRSWTFRRIDRLSYEPKFA